MTIMQQIVANIQARWTAEWAHTGVPVYWRFNDLQRLPNPATVPHFLRNEVEFGLERTMAFGAGLGQNLKAQFGHVAFTVMAARSLGSEDTLLQLLDDARGMFRSYRVEDGLGNTLSFIGDASGRGSAGTDDGNWFYRSAMASFEYRFLG